MALAYQVRTIGKRSICSQCNGRALAERAARTHGSPLLGRTTWFASLKSLGGDGAFALRFFADQAAMKRILSGHNTGTYRVLATEPITGVFEAEFAFASRRLTPHVEAMATN
jgi:hypothetical protein